MAKRKSLELALRVSADLIQARRSLNALERNLSDVDLSAKKAGKGLGEASASASRLHKEVSQLPILLTRMAGLLGAAFSVKEIASAAEAYTEIKNRLALVTTSSEDLAQAQDAIFNVAQAARQPLSATAELYQRIATNADTLKLSGDGVVSVVDVISKSLAISGTSSTASAAALTQLGQAFASGTLRGEELNSVLEQAPALAKTLAKGLGVSVGELRTLGEQGKLSAQNVIQALQSQGDNVDAQFAKIKTTGSQALTVLGNSLIRVVGELDSATGSSTAFANMITELSNWLDSGQLTSGLVESLSIWSAVFESMSSDVESLGVDLDGVGTAADETMKFIITAFKQLPVNIKAAIQITTVEILALIDRVVAYAKYGAAAVKAAFSNNTLDGANKELEQKLKQINQIRQDSIQTILMERDAILEGAAADRKRADQARKDMEESRKSRKENIAAIRASAKNAPITLTGSEGGADKKARDKNEQQALSDSKAIASLQVQLLRAQGNEQEALRLEFENQYGDMLERLKAKGDTAGVDIINKIIDLKKLDTQLSGVEDAINKSLADISRQEESINIEMDAGLISESEAQQKIYDLHMAQAAKLRELRPDLVALESAPGQVAEAAKIAVASLDIEIARLEATSTKLQATLRQGLEKGLKEAIIGLADGTKSFGDAVRAVGTAVADALAQMAANELAKQFAGAIMKTGAEWLSALSGFSEGGYTGDGGKYQVAGVVHRGEGVLSQKDISALGGPSGFFALQNALRNGYAEGGLVGMHAPAIPSPSLRSELASPSKDSGASVQSDPRGLRIINVLDKELVADWANSATGERIIMNVIQRNGRTIKSFL